MADVSKDMREKGLKRCQEFLGGVWNLASSEDFHMEHIRGGLSNLLYKCYLSDNLQPVDGEPVKVLLRVYGQIIRDNPETVLTDSVIFALLAEKNMGPKLYGIFTEGRVEEYVPSRHLYTEELHKPDISVACARIMSQFHKLQMPMVKQPKWLFDTMTRYLSEALNNVSFSDADAEKQEKLQRLLSFGLASELQHLKDLLSRVHSPVVFCHNDLQEGNILLQPYDPDIQPDYSRTAFTLRSIDYEYAHYNYRGFDIGNHFCEWCYNYQIDKPPYFTAKLEDYPNREQQLRFIRAYLAEERSGADTGRLPEITKDEEEAMLMEANLYALASHFLWGVWGIVQSHISSIEFGYLEYALARFSAYFKQKEDLVIEMNHTNGCLTSSVDSL